MFVLLIFPHCKGGIFSTPARTSSWMGLHFSKVFLFLPMSCLWWVHLPRGRKCLRLNWESFFQVWTLVLSVCLCAREREVLWWVLSLFRWLHSQREADVQTEGEACRWIRVFRRQNLIQHSPKEGRISPAALVFTPSSQDFRGMYTSFLCCPFPETDECKYPESSMGK